MSRRKKIVSTIGGVAVVFGLIGLIMHLEPFAPRYEGKTVNQLISDLVDTFVTANVIAVGSISPNTNVVAHFGPKAVPTLVRPSKLPFWHGFLKRIQISALQDYLQKREIRNRFEQATKEGWMLTYCEINPQFEVDSLKRESDALLLAMFQLNKRRLNLYTNHPDEMVRQRALQLLKKI